MAAVATHRAVHGKVNVYRIGMSWIDRKRENMFSCFRTQFIGLPDFQIDITRFIAIDWPKADRYTNVQTFSARDDYLPSIDRRLKIIQTSNGGMPRDLKWIYISNWPWCPVHWSSHHILSSKNASMLTVCYTWLYYVAFNLQHITNSATTPLPCEKCMLSIYRQINCNKTCMWKKYKIEYNVFYLRLANKTDAIIW